MEIYTCVRAVSRVLLTVVGTVWLSGCALGSCGQEAFVPDGGGEVQKDAGPECTDPLCFMPPVPEHEATGGAAAGILTDPVALDPNYIGGPGATAEAGDYYLRNSCVRFIIQKLGRNFSTIPEGGNIIDADLVRPEGDPGADEFGEMTGFLGAMLYTVFDDNSTMSVLNDGSDGAAAVIEITGGRMDVLEYMNIPALLYGASFDAALNQAVVNAQPWINDVHVAVRYALFPQECMVRVTYAFYDSEAPGNSNLSTSVGAFYQAAGVGASFIPGFGFGPISATEAFLRPKYQSKVFGNVGRDVAYSLRAGQYYNAALAPQDIADSSQVTISGLTMTVFGEPAPLAALSPESRISAFTLKPRSGGAYEYFVGVGHDLAEAQAAVALDATMGTVSGQVSPAAAIKDDFKVVVFEDYNLSTPEDRKVTSSFTVHADGTFGGPLPAGTWILEVDAPGYPRRSKRLEVTAGETATISFDLQPTATLTWNVTANGAPTACRISVIGDPGDKVTGIRSNQYRDTLFDTFDQGLVYVEVTSECDSSSTAKGAAGPLKVVPGHYRVVVSRGPEFSIIDQRNVDFTATGTVNVTGDLKRQVATDGWVAVDLHQHAFFSFDSRLPHERRLTAYLAEGMEFFGASEHDRIFDYSSLMDEMGYTGRLATMVGTEISPMHYGHFNAFELTPDLSNPVNGGAPDWSGGPNRTVVTPDDLLGWAQNAGADLISANHPRAPDPITFFYWFDRCGLKVDFAAADRAHAVTCDWNLAVVPGDKLDVADGASLWTDKWDLLEIMNRPTPICRRATNKPACSDTEVTICSGDRTDPDAGRIFDAQIDALMMDWFNMLQVGFIRSIVGNSDSHKIAAEIAGSPRSYVYVGSGLDTPANAGLKNQVKAALLPDPTGSPIRLAARSIATNGPFVTATVTSSKGGSPTQATIGGLLQSDQSSVNVAIHVEAPSWMNVDRIEVFTNQKYDIYDPALLKPGDRNNPTLVQPVLQTDPSLVVPVSVWQTSGDLRYFDTSVTVPIPSLTDSWIVVKVSGSEPMFPVLPDRACFDTGATPPQDPAVDDPFFGTAPIAITNPIFVDRDGISGWRAPEAP